MNKTPPSPTESEPPNPLLRQISATFPKNPQYYTTVTFEKSEADTDGKCSMIAAVMQKYRREGLSKGLENLPIGFGVYKIDGKPAKKLDRAFFQSHQLFAKTMFVNLREVGKFRDRKNGGSVF